MPLLALPTGSENLRIDSCRSILKRKRGFPKFGSTVSRSERPNEWKIGQDCPMMNETARDPRNTEINIMKLPPGHSTRILQRH